MGDQGTDIELFELTKVFQTGILARKVGVENLTLSIPKGQIVGLLGANGSGKSTTLKILLGFLRPTRGRAVICGRKAGTRSSRQLLGYLPENPRFQKFLPGRALLTYFGRLHGMGGSALEHRVDELLDLVGLAKAGKERVQGYSKGMTQRLAIAQALINKPRILIFDEPMSGLDPLGRMEIRTLIRQIHDKSPQTTIFFSTHILSDVEALCSSVALLKKGRLEAYCSIDELLRGDSEQFTLTATGLPPSLQKRYLAESNARQTPLGVMLSIEGSPNLVGYLQELGAHGAKVVSLNSKRRGLEQALFSEPQGMGRLSDILGSEQVSP